MKRLFLSAAVTLLMLKGAAVAAAERLPTFELRGFPICPHQMSVVGSAGVEEASPTATLTWGGMPASPHQIAVLTPRPRIADEALTLGFAKTVTALPR